MKFALPLLVLVAVASPLHAYTLPATGNGALAKELQEFLDLIPLDKVIQLTTTYWTQDKDFQAAVKLMKGEHIVYFLRDLEAEKAFKDLLDWIQADGLDIYEIVNRYHKDLGLAPFVPPYALMSQTITGGLNGYIADLRQVVPVRELTVLMNYKIVHSPVFREFVQKALSPESVKLFEFVRADAHFQMIENEIQKLGLDKKTWESTFQFFMFASVVVQ